jgi:hypothetical protein
VVVALDFGEVVMFLLPWCNAGNSELATLIEHKTMISETYSY